MSLTVNVKDNNIEQALRSMKKKLQREGLFKEMKLRKHYEKPSLKKARENKGIVDFKIKYYVAGKKISIQDFFLSSFSV